LGSPFHGWSARVAFGEHWDPVRLREALERYGYEVTATAVGEIWRPRASVEMPTELLLRRLGGYQRDPRDATWWPRTPLTIAPDRRTVIIHLHGAGASLKALKRASRGDLDRLSGTPSIRAATALGRPVAADVFGGSRLCPRWQAGPGLGKSPADVLAAVAKLHHYEATAMGYMRNDAAAAVEARFVFSFARPWQARVDVGARSFLVERPHPWEPYRAADADGDFILAAASVEEGDLILEVEPVNGQPKPYFDGHRLTNAYHAMCSPTAGPR
jgi:hypothetical protein